MFKQCKETEDSDLNVLEFLAEHVSGVGQLVEGNEHDSDDDDGDKPHVPVQFHFEQQQIICIHQQVRTLIIKPLPTLPLNAVVNDKIYISDYISNIFRPPIFA